MEFNRGVAVVACIPQTCIALELPSPDPVQPEAKATAEIYAKDSAELLEREGVTEA